MGPPLPTVGIGEPLDVAVERLEAAPAALVLDGGHPVGVDQPLRRARRPRRPAADLMADLDGKGFGTRAVHGAGAARPGHRRGRAADLAGHDLPPGGGRQAPRLRVQPQRQPHPRRARDAPRRARGRRATGSRSRRAWPPRTRCCACSRRATTCSCPTTPTAARSASPLQVHAPAGLGVDTVDLTDLDAVRGRVDARRPGWCGSRRRATRGCASSTSRRSARSPTSAARSSSSTTPSPRRRCSSRSPSAPTSSCTPPRSTSAATATWSAASSPPTTTSWPSASASCRTPPAPCPARSTATSCTAAPAPSQLRMERHCETRRGDRRAPRRPPGGRRGALPGPAVAPRPRRRRPADVGASAGWSRSGSPAARRPPSRCAGAPSCSRSPRASARSRASSSTPAA